jgi:thioredoxin 1
MGYIIESQNKKLPDNTPLLSSRFMIYGIASVGILAIGIGIIIWIASLSERQANGFETGQTIESTGETSSPNDLANSFEIGQVAELNESTFEEAIANGVTLIDFWAPWCGPCVIQAPVIEELAKTVGDNALIAKINTDDNETLSRTLKIDAIPCLIIFKDGEEVERIVGLQSNQWTLVSRLKKQWDS